MHALLAWPLSRPLADQQQVCLHAITQLAPHHHHYIYRILLESHLIAPHKHTSNNPTSPNCYITSFVAMDDARAQQVVDQMIRAKGAQFISQIHLLRPLMKKLTTEKKLEAKPGLQLLSFIQPHLTDQILHGQALKCQGYAPRTLGFEMSIKLAKAGEQGCFIESEEWGEVLGHGNIRENAVVSLWIFNVHDQESSTSPKPGFIFRVDGYAKKNERLPPIPSVAN